ncbi:biopolymer transporter ExbD [uncultured Aliiroseovarius sp.]|uniref:ExbD/TolR family protein n=1 Tax=uncultured Aliiroseovarius sp. TaxID=1658783 RepID=UPI0025963F53|nr:biopolymer transporter ExbD [uncultured Aliiroseovarius sp.]
MQFPRPRTRSRPEAIVPMINVVFLLLIFFMMTSQIASAPPFKLSPPKAVGGEGADGGLVLYVSAASGEMAFGATRGEAVFAALAALEPGARLTVTADGALAAPELARLLQRMPEGVALTLTVRQ